MTEQRDPEFSLETFPMNGSEIVLRSVVFGPGVEDFNILISLNPEFGDITMVVGNSPDTTAGFLEEIPQFLRDIAEIIEVDLPMQLAAQD